MHRNLHPLKLKGFFRNLQTLREPTEAPALSIEPDPGLAAKVGRVE
jgi:hypothetical protein